MTDVAIYHPAQVAVPEARDTDSWVAVCSDVIKLANVIHDTEFVPDGLRGSAPAVAAAILAGREMGIGPMTSLQNIHIIKGKPTQSALLMRALVQAQGHKWEDAEVSDTRVVVRGCRRGESKWAEVVFTADQAKRAGIDLGKYPQDKLYARASSRLARRKFADVVAGMPYTPDEIEDGEDQADTAGTITETPAENGTGKAAPRTARRHTPASGAQPTSTAAPAASAAQEPTEGLPPLPGEDEPGPTQPASSSAGQSRLPQETSPSSASSPSSSETEPDDGGTVTTAQLAAIWTVFRKAYAFTDEEKDQARAVAAFIIGRPLESTRQMSRDEAKQVLDTLANWQAIARERDTSPRELLLAYMAEAEKVAGSDGQDPP